MSISVRLTSIQEGALARLLTYLSGEHRTGIGIISFGTSLPTAIFYLVKGSLHGALFGDLMGERVFDFLICHENIIREITFETSNEFPDIVSSIKNLDVKALTISVTQDVQTCAARSFIYGREPVHAQYLESSAGAPSLMQVIHSFDTYRNFFEGTPQVEDDVEAPLRECVLLRRAFANKSMTYLTPLIPLIAFQSLFKLVEPMEPEEAKNLHGYQRTLLPNPVATHMPIERFYALASALESIAYRRGPTVGDQARKIIYKIIRRFLPGDDPGSSGSRVPAGSGGPQPWHSYAQDEPTDEIEDELI